MRKMALISLISPKSLIFISQSVHKQTNICALWIGHLPTADWSVWWTLTNKQWVQCVHWLLTGNLSSWSCDICMQLWLQNCCSHSYRLCWQTHHGWWDSCSPAVPELGQGCTQANLTCQVIPKLTAVANVRDPDIGPERDPIPKTAVCKLLQKWLVLVRMSLWWSRSPSP